MNNLVEAPLDDVYSTATTEPDWVEIHKMDNPIRFESLKLAYELAQQEDVQDPVTRDAVNRDNDERIDDIVRKIYVNDLKEVVLFALGRVPWDIHQSNS